MKVDMRVAADDDLELIIIIITIDSPARGGVTAIILYFDIGATVGTLLTPTDWSSLAPHNLDGVLIREICSTSVTGVKSVSV